MTRTQAHETARELLEIMPLVMRTVAAGLRSAGELPAPAHFPLLMVLSEQPRTLTELAELRGVSLPTMSNSISALVHRGWARRVTPEAEPPTETPQGLATSEIRGRRGHAGRDRRIVLIEVTGAGRAALERVGRCAEQHLAVVLAPLDSHARKRLQAGFAVLKKTFTRPPDSGDRHRRRPGAHA
jgi:DNA-binding MarR family transcriptional regulator